MKYRIDAVLRANFFRNENPIDKLRYDLLCRFLHEINKPARKHRAGKREGATQKNGIF